MIPRLESEEEDIFSHLGLGLLSGGRPIEESKSVQVGSVVFTGILLPGADQASLYVVRRV